MQRNDLLRLLEELRSGERSTDSVADALQQLPFEQNAFATIDHHRTLRTGLPEVIYAEGKLPEQTAVIFERLAASGVPVLATRADQAAFDAVAARLPAATYHPLARCITLPNGAPRLTRGCVAVVCAGTSDLRVADEAAITAELFGADVLRATDVGVAGLHRLLARLPELRRADVVICCAGMDAALPSVVGGLLPVPVIGVPTSVGYGAAFGGVTALLSVLNSCSPNVTAVNIDNGFGAAYVACMIAKAAAASREATTAGHQTRSGAPPHEETS